MFVLIAAAMGGGLATAALAHPLGPAWAAAAVPFGGSAAALLAAGLLAQRRGPDAAAVDLDGQADLMAAALREIAAHGRAVDERRAGAAETAPREDRRGVA
ncbi:hypothetical protein [Methylobacterium oryzisoli]|uniref:hypothetical protein n=1 Tax=Methylobacterium oryzisoli TaxID=3385502 RepID=UPI0038926E36